MFVESQYWFPKFDHWSHDPSNMFSWITILISKIWSAFCLITGHMIIWTCSFEYQYWFPNFKLETFWQLSVVRLWRSKPVSWLIRLLSIVFYGSHTHSVKLHRLWICALAQFSHIFLSSPLCKRILKRIKGRLNFFLHTRGSLLLLKRLIRSRLAIRSS